MALLLCAPARASTTQESILQDDPLLLDASSQAQVDGLFTTFKAIGVDRVRVSVFWNHVAPASLSQRKPSFPDPGPSWPASYPRANWLRFDRIALAAAKTGVGLLFDLTGPAPAWATPGSPRKEGHWRPSPPEFRDFVKAVGLRYSGYYRVNDQPSAAPPLTIGGIPVPGSGQPPEPSSGAILPRVDHWSIWNEPNYPSWLAPVWLHNHPRTPRQMVPASPYHYRRLVDAAYSGLDASGHGGDEVLIGETAPRGGKKPTQLGNAMAPAEFARELYCIKPNYRPYTGRAARLRGCPSTGADRRRFRSAHPGLFRAQGWGHHPYSLDRRRWRLPTWRHPLRDNVPIANLGRLIGTLDRASLYWGSSRGPIKLWITEYGYQTKPQDPLTGVRQSRQGPLSAWGEYTAYRNPRVASIAQFLLADDKPVPGYGLRDPKAWITWQSGLLTHDLAPKPSLRDYQLPLHLVRHRRSVRVFGAYRPGARGAALGAQVQFAREGGSYTALRNILVRNPEGYLSTRVTVPGAGKLRILWGDPSTGRAVASRPQSVR